MSKILIVIMALSLMAMPFAVYAQSEQTAPNSSTEQIASNSPPPVSQKLIPEGDFAMKLVTVLKLGTASNEAQAEDMLSSAGIAPKNGWIADYPMTPVVIGELQKAVVAAADTHKLPMGKEDALKAFQGVTDEFGLALVPGSAGQYAENEAQPNATVINNYYYQEGPPVVTYYPPPWDYYYLYDWVSYPFWCSGFFFPGFFVLNDFDTFVVIGHHHFRVTDHFFDRRMDRLVRVDPTTRTIGRPESAVLGHTEGFRSPEARKAAGSIFNRSFERANRMTTNFRGNVGTQRGMNFRQGQARSFNTPNATHRSFGVAPRMGGRSFSPPSRSFSAPRSFSGGHSFGGFSGGGFHGGGGFGGFHGGGGFGGFHGGGGFGGFHGGGGGFGGGRR